MIDLFGCLVIEFVLLLRLCLVAILDFRKRFQNRGSETCTSTTFTKLQKGVGMLRKFIKGVGVMNKDTERGWKLPKTKNK
jgi:hypothetical protein